MPIPPHIEWIGDARHGHLRLMDQTQLPERIEYLDCRDVQSVWDAIKRLSVRGAPAIGVAAGYGCVIGTQRGAAGDGGGANEQLAARAGLHQAADHLMTSRPTAVNLFWAARRMKRLDPVTPESALAEARRIHDEDAAMCLAIGEHGQAVLERHGVGQGSGAVLTHCNAGALATGGIGTATAPIYLAHRRGLRFPVFADETRPLLQGARLTAFELASAGIDVTILCDSMAGQVMREGRVAMVITGADRIAANGDAANKIGTYSLAVLAHHHRVPFYVAAPSSTFDLSLADGSAIPIEQRNIDEITQGFGRRTAPPHAKAYNPAFDVTPHDLIAGILTEKGLIAPVDATAVARVLAGR